MGTSKEIHFEDLRGLDLSYTFRLLVAGFSKKNFPASLRQKYVFLVPFSMRINTISFQSPYFKIKLVWRVFVAF